MNRSNDVISDGEEADINIRAATDTDDKNVVIIYGVSRDKSDALPANMIVSMQNLLRFDEILFTKFRVILIIHLLNLFNDAIFTLNHILHLRPIWSL